MGVEIVAGARHTQRIRCTRKGCEHDGVATISNEGVQPPAGWWCGVVADPVAGRVNVAVTCSYECLCGYQAEIQKAMDEQARAVAAGVKVVRGG